MKLLRLAIASMLALGLCACESDTKVMPDVTGKKLDVALDDVKSAGFQDDVDVEGGGVFGIVVKSNWEVCEQSPKAGKALSSPPKLTVARTCDEEPSPEPAADEPSATIPSASAYVYAGPEYEVVAVDEAAGMGQLDQYWVYTHGLKDTKAAVKEGARLLITDVAREAGTTELIVQVVSDKEIVEAESTTTGPGFTAAHGDDYWRDVMVPKEASDWIASYTGGIDYDAGQLSDADSAFTVDWWPAGDQPSSEQWKPSSNATS